MSGLIFRLDRFEWILLTLSSCLPPRVTVLTSIWL